MSGAQTTLDRALADWLDASAATLDGDATLAPQVLPRLAAAGAASAGVPVAQGGAGGDVADAVAAIAAVSARSLAAGFVLWGHRSYIEYLLQSPNSALRERLLPDLLAGRLAGATGLSNAMKFLSGLEDLQIAARGDDAHLRLDGKMPWVTNLPPGTFHVAAAVSRPGGGAFVASLASDDAGLERSEDLDLMGLRGTNTAALAITDLPLPPERVIAPDAGAWLPRVRPAFLGLQCGMSIGLARRALAEATDCAGPGRGVLAAPCTTLAAALSDQEEALTKGLRAGTFLSDPAALFRIRIALADIVAEAVGLELQASGGRAYLSGPGAGFARRWREAAFIPVITPSLVQLKSALAAQRRGAA
ncbi:acyl-CoA dehydrogenase family protein [Aquabacter cavernae]|uniref:acyl-CoA dehydrogenase family protein n=1 Tax=Aquabacter cavernae TaxID=2496029 RepID=UPI000F8DBD3B|nr:acyl-CoA dehydrogenase family protein [Aquabacter cavernae]